MCVCVWWGEGGGAGQTGIEKEINKERRTETDRQRDREDREDGEDGKRNDDLLLHQLSGCVCGGGRGAALDRRA